MKRQKSQCVLQILSLIVLASTLFQIPGAVLARNPEGKESSNILGGNTGIDPSEPPENNYYFASAYGTSAKQYATDIKQLSNGNIAVAGSTGNANYATITVLNANAGILWSKKLNYQSISNKITELANGGLILSGSRGTGIYLTRMTVDGPVLWTKNYTLAGIQSATVSNVLDLGDEGLFVAGTANEDVPYLSQIPILMKLDNQGNLEWSKTIPGISSYVVAADITPEGDIVFAGTNPLGGETIIFKITQDGQPVWRREIWTVSMFVEDLDVSTSGEVVLVGRYETKSYVSKLDENGNQMWNRSTGDDMGDNILLSVRFTDDDGLIMTGITADYPNSDILVVKTDEIGSGVWSKRIEGGARDQALVVEEVGGGYLLAGLTESIGFGNEDMFISKISESGDITGCYLIDDASTDMNGLGYSFNTSSLSPTDISVTVTNDKPTFTNYSIERDTVCRVIPIN